MTVFALTMLGFLLQAVLPSGLLAAQPTPFSTRQICKAAIAAMMGRDPATMNARSVGNEVVLSYVRADGTTWTYKCKLEANRVLWGSDPGRWRTHPDDERLYFSVSGPPAARRLEIEERFGDGSSSRKSFSTQQLGR